MRHLRMAAGTIGAATALALVAGCSGGGGKPVNTAAAKPSNAADATFLQDMIAHHAQAIAAGQLAADHGTDPRVVAFGQRIVREQNPELQRMQAMVLTLKLTLSSAQGAAMAVNRITPSELTALAASRAGFDRAVIGDSATSEQGAAQMARVEVSDGRYGPALTIARSIASAANPGSEIAQLQQLAVAL